MERWDITLHVSHCSSDFTTWNGNGRIALIELNCVRFEVLVAVRIKINCDADIGGSRCQLNTVRPYLYHTTQLGGGWLGVSSALQGTAVCRELQYFCCSVAQRLIQVEHFQWHTVSECSVQMFSGSVLKTRHSPRNLAHAYLWHSWQWSSSSLWRA
jgi:hypothetical protein